MHLGHPILMILWRLSTYQESQCRIFQKTLICEGIQQEDFLYQVYRNQEYLDNGDVYNIEIVNSNFSYIKSFLKPMQFRNGVMRLSIKNSSIQRIDKDAFQGFDGIDLDLSSNHIEDIAFIESMNLRSLNLENNRIRVLNLNISGFKFEEIDSIILKGNNIEKIIPSDEFRRFKSIDLSFNQINAFNETNLNCFFSSIDLSYNRLHDSISVVDRLSYPYQDSVKNIINLAGNNISSLGAYTKQGFACKQLYLTSVPTDLPEQFNVEEVFSLANARIGLLNGNVFNISLLNTNVLLDIIDFSNSSISEISKFYFEGVHTSLLNLSHNHLISLNSSIFKDSYIRHLDLSYSKLKALSSNTFDGMRNFEILNLTGNLLGSIENICSSVKFSTIDLSYNRIDRIGVNAFINCTELRVLNMSHSGINYIETGSFANLSSLNFLDLSNNIIISLKEDSFSNLSNIYTIDLSGNRIGVLETNTFHNLSVTNLILSNTTIKYVQNEAFNNLYNLRTLNLSNTGIAFIEQNSFLNLPYLETIDLRYNDLNTVESQTFNNLRISNLYLDGNKIKIIKSRAFESLYSLNILNLSSLEIQVLEPFSFSRLSVDAIDLRDNNISEIGENIFSNITVNRIYLDDNNISSISALDDSVKVTQLSLNFNGVLRPRAFSNINLKRLYLINSSIELLKDNCFMGLFNLEELHLNGSKIDSFEQGALNGLFSLIKFDASDLFRNSTVIGKELFSEMFDLESLVISNVNLTEIQPGAFSGLKKLNELYLSNNSLSLVNGSVFKHLKSLTLLDLSNNSISSINLTNILNCTENLKYLRLSFNRLDSLITDVQYPNLETLFLDYNQIQIISTSTFQGLTGLKILHLQNNGLQTISYGTFRNLSNLQELRLNGNQLNSLNIDIFGGLYQLRMLDLSENSRLFYQTTYFNLMGLKSFSLNSINLDNTYLDSMDYKSLKENNANLREIAINYNRFTCTTLSTMLKYFADVGVNYSPKNPRYDIQSIDGIVCNYSG